MNKFKLLKSSRLKVIRLKKSACTRLEQNIKLKILKITKNIIRIRKLLDEIASIDVRYGILWQKVESRNGKAHA
jgi:hypothetical protein